MAAAEPLKASWLCRCGAGSPTKEGSTLSWWGKFDQKAVQLHSCRELLIDASALAVDEYNASVLVKLKVMLLTLFRRFTPEGKMFSAY